VYKDSDPAKEVRIYRFRSKTQLGPGESQVLSKEGLGIHFSRHVKGRVTRVEYADGTVWQRAKA